MSSYVTSYGIGRVARDYINGNETGTTEQYTEPIIPPLPASQIPREIPGTSINIMSVLSNDSLETSEYNALQNLFKAGSGGRAGTDDEIHALYIAGALGYVHQQPVVGATGGAAIYLPPAPPVGFTPAAIYLPAAPPVGFTPPGQAVVSGNATTTGTPGGTISSGSVGTATTTPTQFNIGDFFMDDSIISGTQNWWVLGGVLAALFFFSKK